MSFTESESMKTAIQAAIVANAEQIADIIVASLNTTKSTKSAKSSKTPVAKSQWDGKRLSAEDFSALKKVRDGIDKAKTSDKIYNVSSGRQISNNTSMHNQYVFHDELGIAGRQDCEKLALAVSLLEKTKGVDLKQLKPISGNFSSVTPKKVERKPVTPKKGRKPATPKSNNKLSLKKLTGTGYFFEESTNLVFEPRMNGKKKTFVVIGTLDEDKKPIPLTDEDIKTAKTRRLKYDENILKEEEEEEEEKFCVGCGNNSKEVNEDGLCISKGKGKYSGCDKCAECGNISMKVDGDNIYCENCNAEDEDCDNDFLGSEKDFYSYHDLMLNSEDTELDDPKAVAKALNIIEEIAQDIIDNYLDYLEKYPIDEEEDEEDEEEDVVQKTVNIVSHQKKQKEE